MKVIKAKTAGFCFGVKRAVDTVYKQVDSCEGKIYTYGPIIHNEEVVKDMESKGVIVLRSEEELDRLSGGTVIIRSHGEGVGASASRSSRISRSACRHGVIISVSLFPPTKDPRSS